MLKNEWEMEIIIDYVKKWMEKHQGNRLKVEFSTDTLKELEKWYLELY